jgi:pantoate--beta-alanine ligase
MSTAVATAPPSLAPPSPVAPLPEVREATPVRVVETLAEYTAALEAVRAAGGTVGLVPTMGALHDGHQSLIRRAADECDVVAVSVFVNPTQFGDAADLATYPRTLESDLETVAAAGGGLVFAPSEDEMYPDGSGSMLSTVSVPALSGLWEGASRPGHFDGVAAVVVKLLSATGRCRAYFGEKDFQQLAVVRRMVTDLSLPVEIVACPTVREASGLALSSRNVRLSDDGRLAAVALHRALTARLGALDAGERDPVRVNAFMRDVLDANEGVAADYAVAVDAATLATPEVLSGEIRLLVAATVGPVRLIDNVGMVLESAEAPVAVA